MSEVLPSPMNSEIFDMITGASGNGKRKQKIEAEIGNGKAEIGKWSSTFVALMPSFAHARSVWG